MLTLENVYSARRVLSEVVRTTDVIYAPKIRTGIELYLKTENLQTTGSFKLRGAYYKMSKLSDEEKSRGVVACSAGNHAQGVALGAKKNGVKAVICLPDTAPISKVEATKSYGAEVCLVKGVYDDAYKRALELRDSEGYTFIHPFNDEDVIAGQGTIALEIIEEMPDVEAVVVPVGGGGLISGIAFTLKTINPKIKVYGVQSQGAPSMANSIEHGEIETLCSVSTVADGIAVKCPGDLTYEMCKKYVDKIVTVSDDEICAAILALMEKHKLVTEGAGAASVAAVMFDKLDLQGKKTVALLSGGNIDVNILSRVINRGLVMSGRIANITLELVDRPGQLTAVTTVLASMGANLIAVLHERSNEDTDVNGCYLKITLETRNHEHIAEIKRALSEGGFKIV